MRIGVIQHRVRAHGRMDLAALLAVSEKALDEGAQMVVYPKVPGISGKRELIEAFHRNVAEHAPGLSWIDATMAYHAGGSFDIRRTALGRTLVMSDDDCIDQDRYHAVQEARCDALVWLFSAEDALQDEAMLELALDASLRLAPLVVVAAASGDQRGVIACGTSAVAQLGEMLVEGVPGESLLVVDLEAPTAFVELPRSVSVPAPVLVQRLSAHRTHGGHVDPDSLI